MSTSKKQSKKSEHVSIIDQLDAKSKKQVSSWIESLGDFLNVDKEESQTILAGLLKALLEKGKSNKRNAGRNSRKSKEIKRLREEVETLKIYMVRVWEVLEHCSVLHKRTSEILAKHNLISFENYEIWDLKEIQEWEERFKGK